MGADASTSFHVQFRTPPRRAIGSVMPRYAAWSNDTASSRFDLPEPFGPISTFDRSISRSIQSGPNDNRLDSFSL